MIIILTSEPSNQSASRIMEAVRRKGVKCIIAHKSNYTKHYFHDADLILRWGCSAPFPINNGKEINSIESMIHVGNKTFCRWKLQNFGCQVPKTWFDVKEAELPFILRPDNHSQGRQFRVVNKKSEFGYHTHLSNYYCSEIIDKSAEYRVHVWNNEPMINYNKNIRPGELLANQAQTGRKWSVVNDQIGIEAIAIDVCDVMGLFTGAVDVMVDRDGSPFVCEINTMPNVKTNALAELYAERLIELL